MGDAAIFPFEPPTLADYAARVPHPDRQAGGRRFSDGKIIAPRRRPLISVITPSLNAADTIEATFKSVIGQTVSGELEHIVVDAASTDGTLQLIRNYEDHFSLWISEPDDGISDGFNKGVALSTGKYILHALADDTLDKGHLAAAIEAIEAKGADFAFGDLHYFDPGGDSYIIKGNPRYADTIRINNPTLNHPTLVARRSNFERYGLFSNRLRVAMDYDIFLRWHGRGLRGVYVETITGHSRLGGASDVKYLRGHREVLQIARAHGAGPRVYWIFLFKLFKTFSHKALRHVLPDRARVWLRGRFNRYYQDITAA